MCGLNDVQTTECDSEQGGVAWKLTDGGGFAAALQSKA